MKRVVGTMKRFAKPGVIAFLLFASLGFATAGDVPWSDDARFYVPSAASYGRWAARVISFDLDALSRQAIDSTFSQNAEHPPVGKYVMAVGWLLLHHWTGLTNEVNAARAGVILLWALMCATVLMMVWRRMSLAAGLFAAGALASMPRLLYHGHAETLDLPVTALYLLTAAAFVKCMEQPRWRTGILTVVLFALTLGAKLNAPFFLVGVVLYLLIDTPLRIEARLLHLPAMPWVLIGMLVVSPLLAWAMWPWLWFDTVGRLQSYVQFHLQHYNIYYYYGGTLYSDAVAPWYAPWVMTLLTLPVPIGLAAVLGSVQPLRFAIHRLPGLKRVAAPTDTPALRLALFAGVQALVQLIAVSLPNVPKYGGIKLFLPALPFLAILAAFGFGAIEREVGKLASGRRRLLITYATVAILLLPGVLGALLYRGGWLSYYNSLAGGVRGATAAGYERQYYDLAYPQLAAALDRLLPNGGSVAVLPNPKEYTPHISRWQRLGLLGRRVRLAPPGRAELLVLTHERRWAQYPLLMAKYRNKPLIYRLAIGGVPMLSIYDLRQSAAR